VLLTIVFGNLDEEAMHMVVESGEQAIGTARIRFLGAGEVKLKRDGSPENLPQYEDREGDFILSH
jgi:hypothetical protein